MKNRDYTFDVSIIAPRTSRGGIIRAAGMQRAFERLTDNATLPVDVAMRRAACHDVAGDDYQTWHHAKHRD